MSGAPRILGCWLAAALLLPAQRYTFRQYGPRQGLANGAVHVLHEDRQGVLWAGTDNGLFRYDGVAFTGFSRADGLPSQFILDLAESPSGELWVATGAGLARWSAALRRFVPVEPCDSHVALAFDGRGGLYVAQESGLRRAEPGGTRFETLIQGPVRGLAVTHQGEAWFARDDDLYRLADGHAVAVGRAMGLPEDVWTGILEDTAGTLWVRSATRLYARPRGRARFEDRTGPGVPACTAWRCRLALDGRGGVLVPGDTGLWVAGGVAIDGEHGLPVAAVRAALVTRDGSLWLGTYGGGLLRRLGRGEWTSWQRADGLPHDTAWVIRPMADGSAWVGTTAGLARLDAGGVVRATFRNPAAGRGSRVEWLVDAPDGGAYFLRRQAGVALVDAAGRLRQTWGREAGLDAAEFTGLMRDGAGHLWVAGGGDRCFRSLEPLGKGPLRFARVATEGWPEGARFSGGLSVGADGAVLVALNTGFARYRGGWRVFTPRDGLRQASVGAVLSAGDAFWVRYTDSLGLTRLRVVGERVDVRHVTQGQGGLTSDAVYSLAADDAGRLWLGTDRGVDVLDAEGRWLRHYGADDGLVADDCDDDALAIDARQRVWIGTSNGVSRLAMPSPFVDPPARVQVSATDANGRVWSVAERPLLPWAQRLLAFSFGSLDFYREAGLAYQYRLTGEVESPWKETREHTVQFASLPAGDYRFEVRAGGVATPFEFRIETPWWQTAWCHALGALALTLAAMGAWRFRVRVLLAQKNRLEQLVAERTAELRESHRQLEEIAYLDGLTALPNRRMFHREFERRLAEHARRGPSARFGLILLDLDRFKPVNDTFGHDAGDAVLVEVARRLRECVREVDCAARLGGDEFALLLAAEDVGALEEVCARLAARLPEPVAFRERELRIGFSAGIALYPTDGPTQDALYQAADVALYAAKRRDSAVAPGGGWRWAGQREGLPAGGR